MCGVCFAKLLLKAVDCLPVKPHQVSYKTVEAFFADLMVCMRNVVRRRLKPPLSISCGALLSIINHVPFAASYASLLVQSTNWTMAGVGRRFARTSWNL